jgi:hypothetical protein
LDVSSYWEREETRNSSSYGYEHKYSVIHKPRDDKGPLDYRCQAYLVLAFKEQVIRLSPRNDPIKAQAAV